ncbi:ABC transporter ATP-binding protein [Longimicrobium sp.]|uniref:ABC transporter ATP-binding protein n=1 Tax=Longimicrobium sp. TaxID=2029185 RepID=UPI003B3B26F4
MSAATGAAPGWRERREALRALPRFLGLVWDTHRGFTAALLALRLARALVPVATLWVARLLLDAVVAASRGDGDAAAVWRLLALEVAIVATGDLLGRLSVLVESLLADLFATHVGGRLLEHAATLDLQQFEDPVVQDQLERARGQTVNQIGLLAQLSGLVQDIVTLTTLAGAVLAYDLWLGVLLAAAVLPSFVGQTHYAGLEYSLLFRWTPQRRRLAYLRSLGSSDRSAKEVKVLGLSPWIAERFRALSTRFNAENRRLAVRRTAGSWLLSLVGLAGYYGAYVSILRAAVRGVVTVGELTFLAAAFARSRELVERILQAVGKVSEQSLYARDLMLFFQIRPLIVSAPGALPVPAEPREGIAFENVGFRYAGREVWALRNVTFRLRPGECLALVGENGAGKSTLVKLLCRLYEPTEGRVTLDGRDLREYDLSSLRSALSVVFQDYVRYDMPFDENIAVGAVRDAALYLDEVDRADEGAAPPPPRALVRAAEQSLAASLLPRLPGGYRQMLGRLFDGGVELSGGEWQKVALARAYMRQATVRVLDEPTAALDARAEYEIFRRFRDLTTGCMSVVISHRFSTVRMADRILVLSGGRMVEHGSHEELLETPGLYAELFGIQAAGYR